MEIQGYTIRYERHAESILKAEFPDAFLELYNVLDSFYIGKNEIILSGGGEASITQRLRRSLSDIGWNKKNTVVEQRVDDRVLISESHEIDHYKEYKKGRICLEIEWNNKDPFYDRDLENFRKLHNIGAISIAIIITRGESLQKELHQTFNEYCSSLKPFDIEKLGDHLEIDITRKQKLAISNSIQKNSDSSPSEIAAKKLFQDKYGQATTHWDKLIDRINRGLGNPCPLMLIGIEKERLISEILLPE
jgi:hypothetical protein